MDAVINKTLSLASSCTEFPFFFVFYVQGKKVNSEWAYLLLKKVYDTYKKKYNK
jgi:hypothetical protein